MRAVDERWIKVLREHWLAGIDCNHEQRTDTARCSCSLIAFPPQTSVGLAVETWIQHIQSKVMELSRA